MQGEVVEESVLLEQARTAPHCKLDHWGHGGTEEREDWINPPFQCPLRWEDCRPSNQKVNQGDSLYHLGQNRHRMGDS